MTVLSLEKQILDVLNAQTTAIATLTQAVAAGTGGTADLSPVLDAVNGLKASVDAVKATIGTEEAAPAPTDTQA